MNREICRKSIKLALDKTKKGNVAMNDYESYEMMIDDSEILEEITPCDCSGVCPYNLDAGRTCDDYCGKKERR